MTGFLEEWAASVAAALEEQGCRWCGRDPAVVALYGRYRSCVMMPDEMVSVRECRECSTKRAEELFQADRPEGGCWRRVGFLGLKDDIGRGVPTSRDEVLRRD